MHALMYVPMHMGIHTHETSAQWKNVFSRRKNVPKTPVYVPICMYI
jgi:hypothetical protein